MDFVIVPLPDLWHRRVETPDVIVLQVVEKISAKFIERFSNFAFCFCGKIFPNGAVGKANRRRNRIVGINRIARVNEKMGLEAAHRLINAHTTDSRIDSETLSHRSEEQTSELQPHSFISYAVFCLKKKKCSTCMNIASTWCSEITSRTGRTLA